MEYSKFKEAYLNNLKIMSRTANGILDTSASEKKKDSMATTDGRKAEQLVYDNMDRVLFYLYENRYRTFRNAKDLGDFIIEIAKMVNEGIVKEGMIFRNGSDSKKMPYAAIRDLEFQWNLFINELFERLKSEENPAAADAAFAEYVINCSAHFFSDGCCKISMLISSYILLRRDLELPKYINRDAYYATVEGRKKPTPENPIDIDSFKKFENYYVSLFAEAPKNLSFQSSFENGLQVIKLGGVLDGTTAGYFRSEIEKLPTESKHEILTIDVKELSFITKAGTDELSSMAARGWKFVLENLNQDCFAALLLADLSDFAGKHTAIPTIDITKLEKLGEGSNGEVYRMNDELTIKVFKNEIDIDEIEKERRLNRMATRAGIPCPISFGYGLVDGKLALQFEMVKNTSLLKLVRRDRTNIQKYIGEYVKLIKDLHSVSVDAMAHLPENTMMKELLQKADRIDSMVDAAYAGKARKILESLDEPEVLIHGDIQPNNIRVGEADTCFIDMETLSAGPEVFDIGALRRTLFSDWEFTDLKDDPFLKIPVKDCEELWNAFIENYYKGTDEKTVQRNLTLAVLVCDILALAKAMKRGQTREQHEERVKQFQAAIDSWETLK